MRVLTLTELMRMTRIELCDLVSRITAALPDFPEGSAERANALLRSRQYPSSPGAARLLALTCPHVKIAIRGPTGLTL